MKHKDNPKTTSLSKLTLKMAAGAIVGAILGASAAVLLSLDNGNSFNQSCAEINLGYSEYDLSGTASDHCTFNYIAGDLLFQIKEHLQQSRGC